MLNWPSSARRLLWIPMLASAALMLTACGGRTKFVEGTALDLKPAPAELTRPAKGPVPLPDRAMPQLEVETAWRQDRANLKICKWEKGALNDYYVTRDAAIMGKRPPAK